MRIGIDIDDTITDLQEDLLTEALKYDVSLRGSGMIYPERHYIAQRFDWSEDEKEYYLGKIRWDVMNNAKIREGVIEVLETLRNEGNEIIFITARCDRYNGNYHEDTHKWLKENKIPFDKLITNARDKGIVCKEEEIDVFIDDQERHCILANAAGIKTIFFDIDNARKENDFVVVYSWHDILNKIHQLVTQ